MADCSAAVGSGIETGVGSRNSRAGYYFCYFVVDDEIVVVDYYHSKKKTFNNVRVNQEA